MCPVSHQQRQVEQHNIKITAILKATINSIIILYYRRMNI